MRHIGDPHQEILSECRERDWIDLFTTHWDMELVQGGDTWMSHPKGHFQPGVLVMRKDGTVLYRWQSRPSRKNVGGAVSRPTPEYVWQKIESALATPPTSHADYDESPDMDVEPVFWPLFVMVLIANGWFIRPRVFNMQVGDDNRIKNNVGKRQKAALRRLPFFFGFWILLFALVPLPVSAGLLTLWVAWITPGVIRVHHSFRSI
ncbi:MAG: hypothetical protein ISP91_05085 [Pseudomonadales bacterium]|jgi:hypothetical protein|nr:hypothetical protein [Pseudomonadales bacterium]